MSYRLYIYVHVYTLTYVCSVEMLDKLVFLLGGKMHTVCEVISFGDKYVVSIVFCESLLSKMCLKFFMRVNVA